MTPSAALYRLTPVESCFFEGVFWAERSKEHKGNHTKFTVIRRILVKEAEYEVVYVGFCRRFGRKV